MDLEFGVCRRKLLHLEWINKISLYSTGNYIQSPGINHNGKEYFKKNVYMYQVGQKVCLGFYTSYGKTQIGQPNIKLSHFSVQQRLAQHCK